MRCFNLICFCHRFPTYSRYKKNLIRRTTLPKVWHSFRQSITNPRSKMSNDKRSNNLLIAYLFVSRESILICRFNNEDKKQNPRRKFYVKLFAFCRYSLDKFVNSKEIEMIGLSYIMPQMKKFHFLSIQES
jgi:hypothetical protein